MSTRAKAGNGKSADAPQAAESTARRQRRIQAEQDRRDSAKAAKKKGSEKKGPVQAGARRQPEKLPAQHLAKPGREADLALAPQFMAPDYRGSGKLEGFAAIVTGGDSGIGRAVAVLFAREGADVTIAYLDEHDDAAETQALHRGRGQALPARRRRRQEGEVRAEGRRQDASMPSAGSTCSSTTPPSRSTPTRSRTSPTSVSRRRSAPTSSATSTWRRRRCRT